MKRQFIFGMMLAPLLLVSAWAIKSLFKPAITVDAIEQKIILEEMNYSTEYKRFSLPTFSFNIQQKGKIFEKTLADFHGKPTILHVWATWCPPCIREMPEFINFAKSYKDTYNIIAINVDIADTPDEAMKTAQPLLDENGGKDLSIIFDHQGKFTRAIGLPGLPATLFLDENGKEIGRVPGIMFWDDPKMPLVIKNLYKQKSA